MKNNLSERLTDTMYSARYFLVELLTLLNKKDVTLNTELNRNKSYHFFNTCLLMSNSNIRFKYSCYEKLHANYISADQQ